MHLVLLRHGPAVDRNDPECPADALRPLTERGGVKTLRAVRGLLRLLEHPPVIRCSPWVRARQTAELLLGVCPPGASLEDEELLTPGHGAYETLGLLLASGAPTLVVVGHAPLLDELVAAALRSACPDLTRLKKAGAACVANPGRSDAQLLWHLPPRVLRALGDAP